MLSCFHQEYRELEVRRKVERDIYPSRYDIADHLVRRWVCVDDCLARAIKQTFSSDPKVKSGRCVVSYDAMCAFCKLIIDRWTEKHPAYVHVVNQAYWVIPVCHCRNHIDSCEPLFLYVYKDGVGHFKGETAEQLWDVINRFGASNRQRNKGGREDAFNGAFGDLNWRKTVGIGESHVVHLFPR